mmetsp:Transcript_12575/g.35334  ORF Transcript_12575/g.35334 Transcript_12575/m.35334 type:complete len:131 (+) Transcript_12575:306-698(+)
MALTFSLRKFPATGQVKSQGGLPFGCVVQPLAQFDKLTTAGSLPALDVVARCSECYAYVNKFCHFERSGWVCSLCGNFNEYHSFLHNRCPDRPDSLSAALPKTWLCLHSHCLWMLQILPAADTPETSGAP